MSKHFHMSYYFIVLIYADTAICFYYYEKSTHAQSSEELNSSVNKIRVLIILISVLNLQV